MFTQITTPDLYNPIYPVSKTEESFYVIDNQFLNKHLLEREESLDKVSHF